MDRCDIDLVLERLSEQIGVLSKALNEAEAALRSGPAIPAICGEEISMVTGRSIRCTLPRGHRCPHFHQLAQGKPTQTSTPRSR